jgi:hypothetical protein
MLDPPISPGMVKRQTIPDFAMPNKETNDDQVERIVCTRICDLCRRVFFSNDLILASLDG